MRRLLVSSRSVAWFGTQSKSRFHSPLALHQPRPICRSITISSIARVQAATMPRQEVEDSTLSQAQGKSSMWGSPGQAAFDFRSDVVTTPTTEMLQAIQSATLLDDVFAEDPTTNDLEAFIAQLTNFPAAVLVLSGTMGNQLALRTHLTAPPHAVLADARGHVIVYEAGGMASLSGAFAQPVQPSNGRHLTLEDVQKHAVLSSDVHACPTRVVSLENTLNGTVMPLAECRRISEWARAHGILMHLDGARLWEAVAAGAGSLVDYGACFDSMSLCFSKGLGAPIGSILVGSEAFVKRARWVRKSIGGGLRQAGVVAAPARVAVESTFLGDKLTASHRNAKHIASMWEGLGGKLTEPVETNMVWLNLDDIDKETWIALGNKHGLRLSRGRLVVHYQIGDEAIQRLQSLFEELLGGTDGKKALNGH